MGVVLFHANRRTDRYDRDNRRFHFVNASKKAYYEKGFEGVDSFPLAQDREKGWGR